MTFYIQRYQPMPFQSNCCPKKIITSDNPTLRNRDGSRVPIKAPTKAPTIPPIESEYNKLVLRLPEDKCTLPAKVAMARPNIKSVPTIFLGSKLVKCNNTRLVNAPAPAEEKPYSMAIKNPNSVTT